MQSPTPPTPAAPAGVPASAPIVLATLNAKFIHASLGLRCLLANMDRHGGAGLRAQTALREFVIQQRPTQIVEDLLALKPRVIGLGVYIWNVVETTQVVRLLKALRPDIKLVLDPAGNVGLGTVAPQAGQTIALVVGPEGGLSERDLATLRAAGFRGLRLGPRILRTETAGLAAVAALQALYGDLRG